MAASVQSAVEEIVLRLAGKGENLCLGGGLATNALLVAALENSGNFKRVWLQPAAGNAGTAVGSAYHAWHQVFGNRERKPPPNLLLGPAFDREHIKQVLENCKLRFQYLMTDEELVETAVRLLSENQIIAWFQGQVYLPGPNHFKQQRIHVVISTR